MIRFISDGALSSCCTFLTGGRAKRLAYAYNESELLEAAKDGALVIGRGSNILFGDYGYGGTVVVNRTSGIAFEERTCTCASGVLLSELCRSFTREGREGLTWAVGLPGTVGGAVIGNAGAFGGCMADVVQAVCVFDGKGVARIENEACGFAYRQSAIKGTVVGVELRAEKGERQAIETAAAQTARKRKESQPQGASAGCIFKAADGKSAGALIDSAGLKGLRVGGAVVSNKHANFIINDGGAKSGDILQLMRTVQAIVYDKFGILLAPEIKRIGAFT
ncbi:MAG: UDP-N-acetylmuramate dehydrogenase [Clostridiales bacterium]|nr:UDP-N-acetylmuramate dehydrogenase [Clostridiales bacterium]